MTAENTAAEQAVLGACLSIGYGDPIRDITAAVAINDWFRPAHATIWNAITELAAEGIPSDPVLVADRLTERGEIGRVGGHLYLHTLLAAACVPAAVQYHCELIANASTLRRVEAAGVRLQQRAAETGIDPAELVAWAAEEVSKARDSRQGVDVLSSSYDVFSSAVPEQRTMVIPGLLGQGDRLVLTGMGGAGKSTVLQQMAVCAAAGIPPFDWQHEDAYEPQRVTILDFENPDHRVKTRLWPMVKDCQQLGADPRPNLHVGGHGNPLNLLNPANALSLLRTVEHDKPALLYVGPAYKMHNDDPDKETVVKKITDVLDSIRAMGVAIITEAHHTKAGQNGGSLEPSGSNLWTWWPEFGLGMRIVAGRGDEVALRRCKLERWRVDRDTASWPDEIQATGKFGLAWERTHGYPMRSAS
jgi:hypothetical protein